MAIATVCGFIGLASGVVVGYVFRDKVRIRLIRLGLLSKPKSQPNLSPPPQEEPAGEAGDDGDYKLVLVVRNDLKMGKGKAAAQCAHAAVMAYEKMRVKNPTLLREWSESGQPKIVVRADDETTLLQLAAHARTVGLTASIVQDAGRTQIAAGSKTVLGVGPGPAAEVDRVTGHLKLY